MRILSFNANGLRSAAEDLGGSTIQHRKPLLEKLPREWKRWRYRARIRALAAAELARRARGGATLTPE